MRVLQVLPRYAPAWSYGGGVRMFWYLATDLVRRGHEVQVVTSDSLSPEARAERLDEEVEGIGVRRYPNRFNRLSAHVGPVFYRPRGMRAGLAELAAWADVLHMGESRGVHNVWATRAAARADRPVVWSAYGGLPLAHGVRGVYRSLYDRLFTRSVVPAVAAFVAQTEHEREVYLAHGAASDRVHLIPLCVDWREFANLPGRGGLRTRLGLGAADRLVVSVARLSPVKGMDMLVRAFAELPDGEHGPYLALVGWDHGAEPELRRLVAELGLERRVLFPGALLAEQRLLAYVDADVFALAPRVYEETSLAALEAAACGIPTVVTRECEVPGLDAAGGGFVAERTPPALAAAIARLLDDEGERARVGACARATVRERFTTERVGEAHERLFEAVRG